MIAFTEGVIGKHGNRTGKFTDFRHLAENLAFRRRDGSPRPLSFGSNFGATDIRHAAFQMAIIARTHSRIKNPGYHFGFSLPKDRHSGNPIESLTLPEWEQIVERAVVELKLDWHQVAWVVHHESGFGRIHIIANRVPMDGGRVWSLRFDYLALRKINRWAASTFQLSTCEGPKRQRARRTDREIRAIRSSGRAVFWSEALAPFRQASSWQEIVERLAEVGFSIHPAESSPTGLVLKHSQGIHKAISHIHPSLSGAKLARRFGEPLEEYLARDPRPASVVDARTQPLTAGRLVEHLDSLYEVWTMKEARAEAWFFPNGNEVLDEIGSRAMEEEGISAVLRPIFVS